MKLPRCELPSRRRSSRGCGQCTSAVRELWVVVTSPALHTEDTSRRTCGKEQWSRWERDAPLDCPSSVLLIRGIGEVGIGLNDR